MIDEMRISSTARWTEDFTVPVAAYGNDNIIYAYIGGDQTYR